MWNEEHCGEKGGKASICKVFLLQDDNAISLENTWLLPEPHVLWRWTASILKAISTLCIWSHGELAACAVNNIKSHCVWELTRNSHPVPPTQDIYYILATVVSSHVVKVSVVWFGLWSQEHLQLLWAGNVGSGSCYGPISGASWTPARRNLPVHSTMLWYQHMFITVTCWLFLVYSWIFSGVTVTF